MTMHKVLHPRDDVERLDVSRTGGGKVLARIKDNVDPSILRLENYIEKCREGLITAGRNDTGGMKTNGMTNN